jgi:sulfur carrier protein
MNGEERDVPADITVEDFVAFLGLDSRGLAIERNKAIVPKSTWKNTVLCPGDAVEIVQFVGGG